MNFFYQNSRNFNYSLGSYLIEDYLRSDSGLGLKKAEKQLKNALKIKTNETFRNFLLNRDNQTLAAIDPKFVGWKALAQNPDPVIQSCRARIALGEVVKLAPLLMFALRTATVTQFFGPIPITVTILTPFIVKSFLALESLYFPNSPLMKTIDKVTNFTSEYIFSIIVAADQLVGLTSPIDLVLKNKYIILATAFNQKVFGVFDHSEKIYVIFSKVIFLSFIGVKEMIIFSVGLTCLSPFVRSNQRWFIDQYINEIYNLNQDVNKEFAKETFDKLIDLGMTKPKDKKDIHWLFSHVETIETLQQEIIVETEETEGRKEKINEAAKQLKDLVVNGIMYSSVKKREWILKYAFNRVAQHQFYKDAVDENNEYILPRLEQQT
ncbi:MAG: hypothetical protein Tsb0021_11150 [Chlamydiales bacterium]